MEVTVRFDLKDAQQFEVFGEFLKLVLKAGFKAIGNSSTIAIPAAPHDSEGGEVMVDAAKQEAGRK